MIWRCISIRAGEYGVYVNGRDERSMRRVPLTNNHLPNNQPFEEPARKKEKPNYTQKAIILKILMKKEQPSLPEPTGKKESKLYPEGYHSDDSNGRISEGSIVPGKEKGTTVLTRTNRKKRKQTIPRRLLFEDSNEFVFPCLLSVFLPRLRRKKEQPSLPEPTGKKESKLYPEGYHSDDSNGKVNGIPVVSFQVETHKKALWGEKKKRHFEKDVLYFSFLASDAEFVFSLFIISEGSIVPGKEKGTTVLTRTNRKKKGKANYTQKAIIPKILMISEGSIVHGKKRNNRPDQNEQGKKGSKLHPEGSYSEDLPVGPMVYL
ncbi:hypothetical protein CEXT_193051 [Caerostris extrusa]|uniref:Uncharacterized protein n=1 Tax=Caerostris extrusa TaxID=172846 RepID=A0AAV4RXP4_CAEEX|nr:hypothetical protein CEXT_193051 [Caerostris extrusa]